MTNIRNAVNALKVVVLDRPWGPPVPCFSSLSNPNICTC
jgi:hypothetical protein